MPPLRRSVAGLSLAEAIIACFVLVGAMVVSGSIFHTALNYSVSIDKKFVGSRVAERRLEEIKSWSRNNHGTNGELEFDAGWETFAAPYDDEEAPGYRVETKIEDRLLQSPSSAFEQVYFSSQEDINIDPMVSPTEQTRTIEGSAKLITATAIWGDSPKDRLSLTSMITDPGKDFGWDEDELDEAVKISVVGGGPFPTSLSKKGEVTLVAEIWDANNNIVKNPGIEWYLEPDSTGHGTLKTRPRYPDRVIFENVVRVDTKPNLPPTNPSKYIEVFGGGEVVIVARARLGGIDVTASTPVIVLEGDTD